MIHSEDEKDKRSEKKEAKHGKPKVDLHEVSWFSLQVANTHAVTSYVTDREKNQDFVRKTRAHEPSPFHSKGNSGVDHDRQANDQ